MLGQIASTTLGLYTATLLLFDYGQDLLKKIKTKLLDKIASITLVFQILLTALFFNKKSKNIFKITFYYFEQTQIMNDN